MRTVAQFAMAMALTAGGIVAMAHDYTREGLKVEHPWARATPGKAQTGAGYVTVTNNGGAADRLTGGESPAANSVEIHTMSMDNGVMRMRALPDGVAIGPGETVVLEPGGMHLMFMGLKTPFEKDDEIPVTLHFEQAGAVEVMMTVEAMGAMKGSH